MTIGSQVKQSLANLKSIHATLQSLALKSVDEQAQRTFHEAMLTTEEVIDHLKQRVSQLEREEPQYKGK
ncbi:uncharacterized protein DUF1657 [Thermolongibacillus altinsuensis]|jgi:conjugal transfer/entry exclusion protein|uniref:Uncharacterized protein DUF1657 n=1 Tax=Thermolongibacillus altinsuensis TaxID=575256 RepID=A0A4R1QEZ8_9BACL|nr:DUF1657 domain-containing protein [Thermolongibacillus altinsuensis]TCL50974.1 uncharacterized protein DUF1657 [Thermolongibacillus altinsuensis]GMB08957.1 NADH dehydrogenase [Thermolongibacillus altinsuensis]